MPLVLGSKNIKRQIIFDAEGDLGEKVPSSFVITVERPSKPVSKQFSRLFAEFADVLAQRQNDDSVSVVEFTERVDTAEQALSDFVKHKIQGWQEVMGPDQQPLEFNPENLEALFADRDARRAVFEDYQALVSGRKKEAEENLKNSGPAGQEPSQ